LKSPDFLELLALGALWGCSFLFMRIASPEFGPVPLVSLRVGAAALFLLPILFHRGSPRQAWGRRGNVTAMAFFNSAFPFTLFTYATLTLTAGYTAVINSAAPLFTAVVAFIWVGERLSRLGVVGLLVGLAGVVVLVWDKLNVDLYGARLAIGAGLLGSFCYGIAANFTRIRLAGLGSLELATGSQVAASLMLAPLAVIFWPEQMPSTRAWLAVLALGVPCTGLAYILFFRLLNRLGPAKAVTVTYLVPLFAMLSGALVLDEAITPRMIAGCALILFGTGLATGLIRPGGRRYGLES
jgi:drug/metabolite transporter (DMT)-like permease